MPAGQPAATAPPPDPRAGVFHLLGRGQTLVGGEGNAVGEGTLALTPPAVEHVIRNDGSGLLVYLSATAPPSAARFPSGRGSRAAPHQHLTRIYQPREVLSERRPISIEATSRDQAAGQRPRRGWPQRGARITDQPPSVKNPYSQLVREKWR
jgi:hypothetical protein